MGPIHPPGPRYCTISTGEYDDYMVHAIIRIPEGRNFRDDWLAFWNLTHPQATDLEPLPSLPDKSLMKKTDRPAWKRLARAYDRARERNGLRRRIVANDALCDMANSLGVCNQAEGVVRRAKIVEDCNKADWTTYSDPELAKTGQIAANFASSLFVPTFLAWLKTLGYEELPYFDARIDDYEEMTTEHADAVSGRPEPT